MIFERTFDLCKPQIFLEEKTKVNVSSVNELEVVLWILLSFFLFFFQARIAHVPTLLFIPLWFTGKRYAIIIKSIVDENLSCIFFIRRCENHSQICQRKITFRGTDRDNGPFGRWKIHSFEYINRLQVSENFIHWFSSNNILKLNVGPNCLINIW